MAFGINMGGDISLEAAADLSAKQYFAVKVDSNGKAALAGAGETVVGILQDKPTSGVFGTVRTLGATPAIAGGTVASGAVVAADAAGKIVTATKGKTDTSDAGAASDPLIGSNVIGICLRGGNANEEISILLTHAGAVPTTAA